MATLGDVGRGVAGAIVTAAAVVYLGSVVVGLARAGSVVHGIAAFGVSSQATQEAASVTLTNRSPLRAIACLRGVITHTQSKAVLASHVVCTGEVAPFTTVHVSAPFRVGAVLETCNKTIGDTKVLDWSKCSFEVDDQSSR